MRAAVKSGGEGGGSGGDAVVAVFSGHSGNIWSVALGNDVAVSASQDSTAYTGTMSKMRTVELRSARCRECSKCCRI